MSQWEDQFQNHSVHAVLRQALVQLESARETAIDTPEATETVLRITRALEMTKSRLAEVDTMVAPFSPLVSLEKSLLAIVSELDSFQQTGKRGPLQNAGNAVDPLVTILNTNYPPSLSMGSNEVADALAETRNEHERFASTSAVHLHKLRAESEELALHTQNTIQELTQRSQETIQELVAQRARLDEAINNFQQQFSDSEIRRNNETQSTFAQFREDLDGIKDERTKIYAEFEKLEAEHSEEARANLSTSGTLLLANLEDLRDQAQALVHVIGNTGMVGGYQKEANESRGASRLWKFLTVAAMGGLIGFAISAIPIGKGAEEFEIGLFAARVFAAITFGILSAYCAKQAEGLDERERKSRKMELELASIDPYLISLPEEQQQEVKRDLAARFFGREEQVKQEKTKTTTGTAKDTTEILKTLVDLVKAGGAG